MKAAALEKELERSDRQAADTNHGEAAWQDLQARDQLRQATQKRLGEVMAAWETAAVELERAGANGWGRSARGGQSKPNPEPFRLGFTGGQPA